MARIPPDTSDKLTPEQEAKPYAKYFRNQPAPPDPEHLKLMEKPCDPAKAFGPERINDLLNPGYLDIEIGWCHPPNGAGFIANLVRMPNVTKDMIEWWFAFHALEDLRYKIWYPPAHHGIAVSPESRKKILDPDVPMTGKLRGITHHVVEDIGCGPEKVDIHFLGPEELGFDMSRFREPNIATFVGGHGNGRPDLALPPGAKVPEAAVRGQAIHKM